MTSDTTWTVATPKRGTEGVSADEHEIHPTGALIFRNRRDMFTEFVIAYAPGAWPALWLESDQ